MGESVVMADMSISSAEFVVVVVGRRGEDECAPRVEVQSSISNLDHAYK